MEPMVKFCPHCGSSDIYRNHPGGDPECVDVVCRTCHTECDIHFDGCVVRDARKRVGQQ